jgi:hypothetical protein
MVRKNIIRDGSFISIAGLVVISNKLELNALYMRQAKKASRKRHANLHHIKFVTTDNAFIMICIPNMIKQP